MVEVAPFDDQALAQFIADNSGVLNFHPVSKGRDLKQVKWVPGTDCLLLLFMHRDLKRGSSVTLRMVSLSSRKVVHEVELSGVDSNCRLEVNDDLLYLINGSHLGIYNVNTLTLVHTFEFNSYVYSISFEQGTPKAYVVLGRFIFQIDTQLFTKTKIHEGAEHGSGSFYYFHPETQVALSTFSYDGSSIETSHNLTTGQGSSIQWDGQVKFIRSLDLFAMTSNDTPRQISLHDPNTFAKVSEATSPVDCRWFIPLSGTNYIIAGFTDTALDVTNWRIFTTLPQIADPSNPGRIVSFTMFDWNESLRCIVSGSAEGIVRFTVI
mmetsp:Transcript_6595/g.11586  ORF Transcript_6595/g.11586 Transcript_6595/m.11586 type:complete len:322 (+) Transcript_6595:70-1035(+)